MKNKHKGLITQEAADKLAKLHGPQAPHKLIEAYDKFLKSETFCNKEVIHFLDRCSRNIVHSTLFREILPEEENKIDSYGILDEEPDFLTIDPIDKCIDVAQIYASIRLMFEAAWASGLLHGKAIYETGMDESFKDLFDTEENLSSKKDIKIEGALEEILNKLKNTGIFKNLKILDIEYEEEDDETNRRRPREEGPEDPRGEIW